MVLLRRADRRTARADVGGRRAIDLEDISELPRLLLLIPTTSYRTRDFLGAAERRGVEVAVGLNQDSVLQGKLLS